MTRYAGTSETIQVTDSAAAFDAKAFAEALRKLRMPPESRHDPIAPRYPTAFCSTSNGAVLSLSAEEGANS